jgi:prepilin-type N-terminal cleavage/methylation domain-containing protein
MHRIPRGEDGLTLVEVLIAVVILSFGSVAVVGALGTLSTGSSINRSQANVGAVVRSAAETLKNVAYIPCTNAAFYNSGTATYGYSASLSTPINVNDPPGNPPLKATVIKVTDQTGTKPLNVPANCGSDPGLQLVTVQDTNKDGKVVATLTVSKSAIDHTPNPAVSPTVTGTASVGSILIGSGVADSVTVAGTGGKTPTGTAHFYICGPDPVATPCSSDATNVGDLGTVGLSNGGANGLATSSLYHPAAVGTWCFLVAYLGDSNYNPNSDATIAKQCFVVTAPPTQFSMVVAATSGANTLVVQGAHGNLSVVGPLMIDSSTDAAVQAATAGDLTSTGPQAGFYTAGAGIATCTGAGCPLLWAGPISPPNDPLATLTAPSPPPPGGSCTKSGSVTTCQPGTYAADPKPGTGPTGGVTTIVFNSGNYVFNNGLTVNGNLAVQGSGVFFYISGGKATLTTTSVNLSAPSSGAYQGILLFQSRTNTTNTVVLGANNAGASSLQGMIYVPKASVQFNNNNNMALTVGSLWAQTVTVQDNAVVVVN